MKKLFLVVVSFVFGMNVIAKGNEQWIYCDGKIDKVFEISAGSNGTEILRMYKDKTYEHLLYSLKKNGKEEVERIIGKYAINKTKITFTAPAKKAFSGKFKYGTFLYNGKFYANLFDMTFRKKKELFTSTRDRKFFKPFFMCLNKDVVINNSESDEQIDLKRLLNYILEGKEKEEDKVMAIMRLIIESIAYDYDGYYKGTYINKQTDAKSILAGSNRLAVCAGYSYTMKTLCDTAGIQAEWVSGNTKQGFADLMHLGGNHAWNIITVNGKKHLYDVTWADDGTTIDMRWVDVDPLVMLGTHFPSQSEDQLVKNPMTQEQFLKTPVITPMRSQAKPIAMRLNAKQFAGNTFKFALPGKHAIEGTLAPASLVETVYNSESGSSSTSYSPKEIGSSYTEGDTDLLKHYITKANKKHSDTYIKGVIAAIKLNDIKALKELVGGENTTFFDKKGKLKLDKKAVAACVNWSGELTSLTRTRHFSFSIKSEETNQTEKDELHIEIPDKLKFMLEFDGQNYSIIGLEVF
ncbi:MAG: hypothetical protein LW704_09710 [Cryomorphaceae bacterium]|nr:hypothetical protein [Cryomorphaceae bacterium]